MKSASGEMNFQVSQNQMKERIDLYLVNRIPNISRSRIKQHIEAGLVTVDSIPVKASHKVAPGEKVTIKLEPRPQPSFEPVNIPLDVLYEDDNLVVVNKPAGLVAHPGHGNWSGTLMNALLGRFTHLQGLGRDFRAGIVHRLDKDTTGLIVAALDEYTLGELGKQFSARTIERKYNAIVWGNPKEESGLIEGGLGRSQRDRKLFTVTPQGKPAFTRYTVQERFDLHSLLEITLGTGRTHQIRVHLRHLGHPVFGDPVYGGRYARFGSISSMQRTVCASYLEVMKRQALHARTLGFFHPVKREFMRFDSDLPEDFARTLELMRSE